MEEILPSIFDELDNGFVTFLSNEALGFGLYVPKKSAPELKITEGIII